MPFSTFPIPTQELATLAPTEFPLVALDFTPNMPYNTGGFIGHNAYHGNFWTVSDTPGDCFWEAWVAPSYGAEYVISAGFGGSHPILMGFNAAGSGKLKMTGNVYNGTTNISFTSIDGVDPDTWHHIAAGVDHTANFIYVYLDGVLTDKVSFTSTRTVGGSSSDIGLYIGGSDHSNFKGKILRVRGFEGQIPFPSSTFPAAFSPETVFGSVKVSGTTEYESQFVTDYSTKSEVLVDYSSGYNGSTHSGKRAYGTNGGWSFDDRLPQWVVADFEKPPLVDTPESIPGGAIVFDDFKRVNQTFALFETGNDSVFPPLGDARTGQTWEGSWIDGTPIVGILEGSAVGLGGDENAQDEAHIDSSTTNYTLTIDRLGSGAITAYVRRSAANDFAFVSLSSTACTVYQNVAGGGVTLLATLTAPTDPAWTRAAITLAGTALTVAITGGGGGATALNAGLTGTEVGFATTGLGRVRRFLVTA